MAVAIRETVHSSGMSATKTSELSPVSSSFFVLVQAWHTDHRATNDEHPYRPTTLKKHYRAIHSYQ